MPKENHGVLDKLARKQFFEGLDQKRFQKSRTVRLPQAEQLAQDRLVQRDEPRVVLEQSWVETRAGHLLGQLDVQVVIQLTVQQPAEQTVVPRVDEVDPNANERLAQKR